MASWPGLQRVGPPCEECDLENDVQHVVKRGRSYLVSVPEAAPLLRHFAPTMCNIIQQFY